MIRVLSFVAAAFALVACASTPAAPPYAAATSATSAGYSETQIESNRYFVTYRAPSGAEAARLEDYALLVGSIGLFMILGAVMYFSRKIDWSK